MDIVIVGAGLSYFLYHIIKELRKDYQLFRTKHLP